MNIQYITDATESYLSDLILDEKSRIEIDNKLEDIVEYILIRDRRLRSQDMDLYLFLQEHISARRTFVENSINEFLFEHKLIQEDLGLSSLMVLLGGYFAVTKGLNVLGAVTHKVGTLHEKISKWANFRPPPEDVRFDKPELGKRFIDAISDLDLKKLPAIVRDTIVQFGKRSGYSVTHVGEGTKKILAKAWNEMTTSEREKITYKMMEKNLSNCLDKCGININDKADELEKIKAELSGETVTLKSTLNPFSSDNEIYTSYDEKEKIKKDAKCIINCYLDFLTSEFAEFSSIYHNCLVWTGGANLDSQPSSLNVLMNYPSTTSCKAIYTELKSCYEDFNKILDELVEKDDDKMEWIKILDTKVAGLSRNTHLMPNVPKFVKFANKFDSKDVIYKPKFIGI